MFGYFTSVSSAAQYCYKLYKNALLDAIARNGILGHSVMAYGSQQRVETGANDAHSLVDVNVFASEAWGRCPSEAVEEIRQHELVRRQGKVNPRASSSTRGEWQKMEIVAIDVYCGVFESAGLKLVWTLPSCRVSPNGVNVDIGGGVGGDAVSAEGTFLATEVRDGERCGRVQPERLFHDAVKERQVGTVRFLDQPLSPHDFV